jgi:hypothetical protein
VRGALATLLVVLLALVAAEADAQISPGPLSQPHAKLEGAKNCFQCHETGKGVTADKCLACHKQMRGGAHARAGWKQCERCHNEHHGRAFQLIHWNPKAFDHRLTSFPLTGAHAKADCKECHKTRSHLGLSQRCTSCHADVHKGQFPANGCTSCHTTTAWKPPSLFSHDKTRFPLVGKHAAVACSKCHPAKPHTIFKPIPHGRCVDCHKDPHAGRFGTSCTNCHSVSGFKPVQFDHSLIPKQACTNCHRNRDVHDGRLGAKCDTCHTTNGWRPARRENFSHDRTRFPLTGKHRAVVCASCHRESPIRAPMVCSSCHRDPHGGRLGTACERCHTTAGFGSVKAGAFDHDKTRFPLRGAHARADCAECHAKQKTPPRTCTGCHTDPHKGQFGKRDCTSCHTIERFVPATFTLAEHQKTRFPLAGAHLAVPCTACHAGGRFRLAATPNECQTCHRSPHGNAVTGTCTSCHRVESWSRIAYDHRTFPLEGAHARVRCGACHQNLTEFRGTPRTCAGCH